MNRTGIEYLTHTTNPYTGCRNHLEGVCGGGGQDFNCWAKGRTRLSPQHYPFGFEPTVCLWRLDDLLLKSKTPARIGVSFMGDLFGDWMCRNEFHLIGAAGAIIDYRLEWTWQRIRGEIFARITACPQHRYLFLTKCPWNLAAWNPWPPNAWVGASVTNKRQADYALAGLSQVQASVRFISAEPLLQDLDISTEDLLDAGIGWVIIGPETGNRKGKVTPRREWIDEIEAAADRAGIPVWEKSSREMRALLGRELRQERPR